MSHQVSNQASVVTDRLRTLSVGDASSLDDRRIVSHVVDQGHETVRKHGVTHPDLSIGFGHGRTRHRGGTVSHAAGTELSKIKAAKEVMKQRGKT